MIELCSGIGHQRQFQRGHSAQTGSGDDDFALGVTVPVSSLCPCSKEISVYGDHNQREYVSIEVRSNRNPDGTPRFIWIEELVDLAERSASLPLYPVLKRPDERYVTMQAYASGLRRGLGVRENFAMMRIPAPGMTRRFR